MLSEVSFANLLGSIKPGSMSIFDDLTRLSPEQWQTMIQRITQNRKLSLVQLHDCNLTNLPASQRQELINLLSNCQDISHLALQDLNLFTSTVNCLEELCNLLIKLPHLTYLDLSCNSLGQASPEHIRVLGNALTSVKSLKAITLGKNLSELTVDLWQHLCKILEQCKKIEVLNISNNNLFQMPADKWLALQPVLAQCYEVDLRSNNLASITQAQGQALGFVFAKCNRLRNIRLGDEVLHVVWQEQWQYLGYALSRCPSPLSLDWYGWQSNDLRELQWQAFCNAILFKPLREFQISSYSDSIAMIPAARWEYFGTEIEKIETLRKIHIFLLFDFHVQSVTQWRAFCKAITKNPNIREISLNFTGLSSMSSENLEVLGNALAGCKRLQTLSLQASIDQTIDQWQEFCNSITKCPSLEKLELRMWDFLKLPMQRVQMLGNALAKATNLRSIALENHEYGASELQLQWFTAAIAQFKCPQKFELSLSFQDDPTTDQLQLLADALAQWQNLSGLEMDLKDGSDHATWKTTCKVFSGCTKLQHIRLPSILPQWYTTNDLKLLAKTFKQSTALRSIDLRYNDFEEATLAKIFSILPAKVTTIKLVESDIQPFLQNDHDQLPYIIEYDSEEETAKIGCNGDPEFRLGVMQFLYKLTQSRIRNQQDHIGLGFLKERGFYERFGPYLTYHDMKRMQPPVVAADANKASASIKLA